MGGFFVATKNAHNRGLTKMTRDAR
jgi:hypothetical protein